MSPLRAARSSRLCWQAWRGRRQDEAGKLSPASRGGGPGPHGGYEAEVGRGPSLGRVTENAKEKRPSSTLTGEQWEAEEGST